MTRAHAAMTFVAASFLGMSVNAHAAEVTLDYGYYKANVEPVFLKKREGHARCFVCHSDANNAFRLQKLPEHANAWPEEASRKNFTLVSALVTPGNPEKSHLLMYPLAPEAGGSTYHSGGRQFVGKNDPDWKIIAAWVNGARAASGASK